MAVFKFTPDDSVLIPAGAPAGTAAFSDDKAGADSLIVDTSAFLISLATNGRGANLANTKAWTVTINGSVFSDDAEGLFLAADNAEKSAITIDGSVRGDEHGIFAGSKVDIVNDGDIFGEKNGITLTDSGAHKITNTGDITGGVIGGVFAIQVTNALAGTTIVNSGSITGGIQLGGGTNSVQNSALIGSFVEFNDGNDTLKNTGSIAGAVLLHNGINSVNNSGTIKGSVSGGTGNDTITNTGTIDSFVSLFGGTNKLTNNGTIKGNAVAADDNDTFVNTGEILGDVQLNSGTNSLTNSGRITGVVTGLGGKDTLTNSGTINLAIDLGGNDDVVTNSGSAFDIILGDGNDKLTNSRFAAVVKAGDGNDTVIHQASGTLAAVQLGEGDNNALSNAGHIFSFGLSSVLGGAGNDKLTNSGVIDDDVILFGGNNIVVNSGDLGTVILGDGNDTVTNQAGGTISVLELGNGTNFFTNLLGASFSDDLRGGANDDKVVNFGELDDVELAGGNNTVTNSGEIDDYTGGADNDVVTNSGVIEEVTLGDGANKLTNSGLIEEGVTAGNGADTVTNTGKILDDIDLGGGDDTFTGGAFVETVLDGDGADNIKLAGQNDTYIATGAGAADGTDTINGGTGVDLYDASAATTDLNINIDAVARNLFQFGLIFQAANTATGTSVAQALKDTITNFEDETAGAGNDKIFGSAGANVLEGGGGADDIAGFGGNDTLLGGAGNDRLVGGLGSDTLTGGANADLFILFASNESGITKATRDVVTDFQDGTDKIDLSRVDANVLVNPDPALPQVPDPFTFIGSNEEFTGVAGQLRTFFSAKGHIIEGDTNGDRRADFSIEVLDPTHVITWDPTDFLGLI